MTTPPAPVPSTTKPANAFLVTLPQTLVGLLLLAPIVVFGYTGHLNKPDTYAGIMAMVGLVGFTGVYVLASQWSNVNALPHLIVGAGIIAGIVVLGLHNVFDSGQLLALITLIGTGMAGGAGAAVVGSAGKAALTGTGTVA